jgi:hypothetical protein
VLCRARGADEPSSSLGHPPTSCRGYPRLPVRDAVDEPATRRRSRSGAAPGRLVIASRAIEPRTEAPALRRQRGTRRGAANPCAAAADTALIAPSA